MAFKRILGALAVGAVGALTGGLAAAYLGLKVKASAILGGISGALGILTAKGAAVGSSRPVSVVLRAPVAPAQWVLGRGPTEGRLAYAEIRQSTLHLALMLSEGRCNSLESIIVDDTEIGLAKSGNGYQAETEINGVLDSSRPVLRVTPYFAADGTGGASLRAVSQNGWTPTDMLAGKSWVHVELNQWVGGRSVFERVPKIKAIMKGLEITWPGQESPAWTESAAALRWWWETERKGVPADEIDLESVIVAHGICTDLLEYEIPAEMQAAYGENGGPTLRSMRYAVGGSIFSDDNPSSVDQQFDLAWAGAVVSDLGVRRFLPGYAHEPVRTITGEDIAEFLGRIRGVSQTGAVSAIRASLAASRFHHFGPLVMPPFVFGSAPGSLPYNEGDAGQASLVNCPFQMGRLQGYLGRRARATERWQYRMLAGRAMGNLAFRLGDVVDIYDETNGLSGDRMVVVSADIEEDWTVIVTLSPQLDWTPAWVAPPLPEGSISGGGTGNPDPGVVPGSLTFDDA